MYRTKESRGSMQETTCSERVHDMKKIRAVMLYAWLPAAVAMKKTGKKALRSFSTTNLQLWALGIQRIHHERIALQDMTFPQLYLRVEQV